MARAGRRIGVIGATGALGSEVLAALDAASVPVADVVAVATDRSLGQEVEFQGELYPVLCEVPSVRGLDVLFLCAPPSASLEFAREALRAEVPCIDLSGAMAAQPEVPLRLADPERGAPGEPQPLLATPPGVALPWALVLGPLAAAAGLRRVVGTLLEGASAGGRQGIEALYQETLSLFNQTEAPESDAFPRPIAFDCLPATGDVGEGGHRGCEVVLAAAMQRLLGREVRCAATVVQVPTFVAQGSGLTLETERDLDPKQAEDLLDAAPRVEVWRADTEGPTTRAASGRDVVLVGRVRRDPSAERSLQLWLAADPLRLAAANAVDLAIDLLGER